MRRPYIILIHDAARARRPGYCHAADGPATAADPRALLQAARLRGIDVIHLVRAIWIPRLLKLEPRHLHLLLQRLVLQCITRRLALRFIAAKPQILTTNPEVSLRKALIPLCFLQRYKAR